MSRARLTVLLPAALIFVVGCASTPPPTPAEEAALPPDFSVDLTIVAGHKPEPGVPAQLQPGRYVIFPDGTLHHGLPQADGPAAGWLPPVTRFLDRDQVAAIWTLARELGLADAAVADPLVNFNRIAPRADQTLYLLALTAKGERWNFVQDADDPSAGRPVAPLARALADLAWISDGYEPKPLIIPKRYDFGPDPHAQYRR